MLKRPETNLRLFIEMTVLLLMAIGTVSVFSAGANVSTDYNLQRFYSFTTLKQIIFFPIAAAFMYIIARIDYQRLSFTRPGTLKSLTPYLLILSIVLLGLVLIPGIGVGIGPGRNFARRWLHLPIGPASVSFQPSELAKWAVIFFLAASIEKFGTSLKLYWQRFLPICLVTGLVVALIVTQDFGTAAFIALLVFVMLVIARARWWHLLTPIPVLAPVFFYAVASSPHRLDRLKAFFSPETAGPAVYQASQSLLAISSGRIWGKGLGRGISKYGHLPEDTTDFVFAIIAEELGFAGAAFVIALFVAFIVAGIIVILRCRDRFGQLLAGGIVLTIGSQAAINIGVVTVVLPTKGIPLPFISAGGTSMLLSAAAVGVLLNIAKQTEQTLEGNLEVEQRELSPGQG